MATCHTTPKAPDWFYVLSSSFLLSLWLLLSSLSLPFLLSFIVGVAQYRLQGPAALVGFVALPLLPSHRHRSRDGPGKNCRTPCLAIDIGYRQHYDDAAAYDYYSYRWLRAYLGRICVWFYPEPQRAKPYANLQP